MVLQVIMEMRGRVDELPHPPGVVQVHFHLEVHSGRQVRHYEPVFSLPVSARTACPFFSDIGFEHRKANFLTRAGL